MSTEDTNSDSDSSTEQYSTHQEAEQAAKKLFEGNNEVSIKQIQNFDWNQFDLSEAESNVDYPHREPHILAYLYWIEGLNQTGIAERYGYTPSCISKQMDEIPTGSDPSKHSGSVGFYFNEGHGKIYSQYDGDSEFVYSHRLLAVAEYGIDAVKDKDIHHETGWGLDNRPDAISLMEPEEHIHLHRSDESEYVIEDREPRLRNGNAEPDAISAVKAWCYPVDDEDVDADVTTDSVVSNFEGSSAD